MPDLHENIYPACSVAERIITLGGLRRTELLQRLYQHLIHLNTYAELLLNDARMVLSPTRYSLCTIELAAHNLGFPDGATTARIFATAQQLGLTLCPLELAPYLRMQYTDQPEDVDEKVCKNQAPSGSVTVASEPISQEDTFPKGFYVRHMNGELWLRGYCADDLHCWNAEDRFIFVKEVVRGNHM